MDENESNTVWVVLCKGDNPLCGSYGEITRQVVVFADEQAAKTFASDYEATDPFFRWTEVHQALMPFHHETNNFFL